MEAFVKETALSILFICDFCVAHAWKSSCFDFVDKSLSFMRLWCAVEVYDGVLCICIRKDTSLHISFSAFIN